MYKIYCTKAESAATPHSIHKVWQWQHHFSGKSKRRPLHPSQRSDPSPPQIEGRHKLTSLDCKSNSICHLLKWQTAIEKWTFLSPSLSLPPWSRGPKGSIKSPLRWSQTTGRSICSWCHDLTQHRIQSAHCDQYNMQTLRFMLQEWRKPDCSFQFVFSLRQSKLIQWEEANIILQQLTGNVPTCC